MSLPINLTVAFIATFLIATVTSAPTKDVLTEVQDRPFSIPIEDQLPNGQDPMATSGMFQGDIAVAPRPRFRTKSTNRLWEDGKVYFRISPEMGKLNQL